MPHQIRRGINRVTDWTLSSGGRVVILAAWAILTIGSGYFLRGLIIGDPTAASPLVWNDSPYNQAHNLEARGSADAPSDEGRPSSAPLASRGARLMDRPYTVSDTKRILLARGLRAFGDGFVALLVPIYLIELGFSPLAIGAVVTSTLLGTAVLTLWVGMVANRYSVRRLLLACALLMAATGAGFAMTTAFWPLLLIAFVGTMNPTSGDASIFLPLEQAALAQTADPRRRTAMFARYSVIGSLAGAITRNPTQNPSLSQCGLRGSWGSFTFSFSADAYRNADRHLQSRLGDCEGR